MANDFLSGYLPYLLHRADLLISEEFHRALVAQGLSVSEWRVLAVLRDGDVRTVGELSTATMLPQPTTTHAVSRLVDDGLVRRQDSSADRRRKVVSLTGAGRQKADELVSMATASEASALDPFDATDREDLLILVRRLVQALEAH